MGGIHFVGKNKEDAKVFQHGALRDHLQVQHTTHRYQPVSSGTKRKPVKEKRTPRIMTQTNPNTFSAANSNQASAIRRRCGNVNDDIVLSQDMTH